MAALQPGRREAEVDAEIEALVERSFLVRSRSALADQHQFRFSHVLMREAAYGLITKRRRAQLHEGLADWLEQRDDDGELGLAAAIGRHLADAHDYRAALGEPEAELAELARRATQQLARGSTDATEREDDRLAFDLLERARALAASAEELAPIFADLAEAGYRLGEIDAASEAADAAIVAAATAGDVRSEWIARLLRATAICQGDVTDRHYENYAAEARAAVEALAETDDYLALTAAWSTLAHSLLFVGSGEAAQEASEVAARNAGRSGRRRAETLARESQIFSYARGPAHITSLARISHECLKPQRKLGGARLEGVLLMGLGFARGAQGSLDEARALFDRSTRITDQLSPVDLDRSALVLGHG